MSSSSLENSFSAPEEVVVEILSWLPVASLLRFKSVCKSWHDLIESSFLTNQHLHQNRHDNILFMDRDYGGKFSLVSGDNLEFPRQIDLPDNPRIKGEIARFLHMVTCNGIICLHYDEETTFAIHDADIVYVMNGFIWNPATRHFRAIPRPVMPAERKYITSTIHCGFGYDVKTDDYKLVAIFLDNFDCQKTQVQVYSFNNNSWRTICSGFLCDEETEFTSDPRTPYMNRYYCWLVSGPCASENHEYVWPHYILSFDFGDEKFEKTPLPDDPSVERHHYPALAVLSNKMACINAVRPFDENGMNHFDIWVLNEHGVRESWTKIYTVGPFLRLEPLRILKNRFLLMKKSEELSKWNKYLQNDKELCIYDIVSGEMKDISFGRDYNEIVMYKESLLWIKEQDGAPARVSLPQKPVRCNSPA